MKKLIALLAAALLLLTALTAAAETIPTTKDKIHFEGFCMHDFANDADSKWVGFDSTAPGEVETYSFTLTTYAAAYCGGRVYGYVYGYDASGELQDGFYTFNTDDHIVSYPGGGSGGEFVYGMAYNYNDGVMYALCDEDHPYIASVDLTSGALTRVVDIDLGSYLGLYTFAIDPQGTFYALTMSALNARLVRINVSTGALTLVGETGLPCYYAQSMTCNPGDGMLYWAELDSATANGLYRIDPATAAVEFIGKIGEEGMEIMALYVVPDEEPGQPDYLLGDVDGNGEVTATDALLALRYSMEAVVLTEEQIMRGDLNGDGAITATEALIILRYSMGLADEL